MSLHDEVMEQMRVAHDELRAADVISPTTLAQCVFDYFRNDAKFEPHLEYTSMQHLKDMARRVLAHEHDPVVRIGEVAASGQQDCFSELLQDRYPIRVPKGHEPEYRRRDNMSDAELIWNERRLDRTGDAFKDHSRAMRAYRESRHEVTA